MNANKGKGPQLDPVAAGVLLRQARERLGLTQGQVAEQAGIPTVTQVSEYENGKVSPARSKYFPALARVLRLSHAEVSQINPCAVVTLDAPQSPSPLPPGLLEASDEYGPAYPLLKKPQVLEALSRAGFFGKGPQSTQDWFQYFMSVRHWIDTE